MSLPDLRSRLYFVLPTGLPTEQLLSMVDAAVAGGVGIMQYREKDKPTRQMMEEAVLIMRRTRPAGVPLVINDRTDIALAVEADGVHVGQEDMPVGIARKLLGPSAIMGATTPSPQAIVQADSEGASYVAIGAMFPSPTKPEKSAVGVGAIKAARQATTLPICAIGGINKGNIGQLLAEDVALYAVISAISSADDPQAAAAELVAIISGRAGDRQSS